MTGDDKPAASVRDEMEAFVREAAELYDVPASARICEEDPAGMLQIMVFRAQALRVKLRQ